MLPWEYSKYGVPLLKNERIETLAYQVLKKYESHTIQEPGKAPIFDMLEYLRQERGVNFNITPLGTRDEYKILGRIYFKENIISLDEEMFREGGSLFLFTGAHEIGHWFLHRHHPIIEPNQQATLSELLDDKRTLTYKPDQLFHTSREWIEHHANKFAAALLMPRNMIQVAVERIQENMGIYRNQGTIYLNPDDGSRDDFKRMILELQAIFGTSKTALRYRLENLGILITSPNHRW